MVRVNSSKKRNCSVRAGATKIPTTVHQASRTKAAVKPAVTDSDARIACGIATTKRPILWR